MRAWRRVALLLLPLALAAGDAASPSVRLGRGLHSLAEVAAALRQAGQGGLRVDELYAQTPIYVDGATYASRELLTAVLAASGLELRVQGGEVLLTAPQLTPGGEERSLQTNVNTLLAAQHDALKPALWALPWPVAGAPVTLDYAKLSPPQRSGVDALLKHQRETHAGVGQGPVTKVELQPGLHLGLTRNAAKR